MIDRMTGAWYPSYPNQTPEQDPDFVRVYGNRQNNAQNGQQGGVAMTRNGTPTVTRPATSGRADRVTAYAGTPGG